MAVLSSGLSVCFDRMATSEFLKFFSEEKFDHGVIKRLKARMIAFSSILKDAENKQFANADVRAWLMELKDAAYDVEDWLGEIQLKYDNRSDVAHSQKGSSSSQDQPTLKEKLRDILLRLEDLMKDSAVFGLSKAVGEKRSSEKRETTSLVDKLEAFYGRDADKKALLEMLKCDNVNGSNPGVIPIVGMGGIGKTTLAKHVYNNKEVENMFQKRAWVCVSDQFDETKVTKEIVEKVTGTACLYNDLDRLQHTLKAALHGQRFLLVLDDVWSEDDEKSRNLLAPLRFGAKGSKIIITSRSKEVASKMQTVPSYDLSKLEDRDSLNLFASHACYDSNSTTNPELREIGEEIAKKCGGLPLALKALGSVLRFQTNADKWKEVLEMEIWDVQNANILPALAVSYIHLPLHLKRCFAYCAIFPQHYEFRKEDLVALWRSESLLVQQKGNHTLEEIGGGCFDDLVSGSFFQHSSTSSGKPCFVMHDLVHDLARFVSGEFCSRLEGGTSSRIGKRTRHLSYKSTEVDGELEKKSPSLRSFVLAQQSGCNCDSQNPCIDERFIGKILPKQKLLRVLSLPCRRVNQIPSSIRMLQYMRHLDLSHTSIKLLPDCVTALFNLEILILHDCKDLQALPREMQRLVNLCHLDLDGTELKQMPPHLGKLQKLSKLTYFVVGNSGGSSIEELGQLHHLRGEICIRGLETVGDGEEAMKANLKGKGNLKELNLSWDHDGDHDGNDSGRQKEVLEKLEPHLHIERITIKGYRGTELPNWVRNSSVEKLSISGGSNDSVANTEAIGQRKIQFPSLKFIRFEDMLNWREWSSCNGAFSVLERLELIDCPELLSVPSGLPSLKRLRIDDCPELDFENFLISASATLESVEIDGSEKVKCISVKTFSNLKKLSVKNCSNLESLSSTATTTTTRTTAPLLQSLEIINCKKLVAGRKKWGLQALPFLSNFTIGGGIQEDVESSFPEEMLLPSSLVSLRIEGFTKLISLNYQGLQNLTSLQSLEIFNCENLESLPPCPFSLHIYGCPLLERRCERELG